MKKICTLLLAALLGGVAAQAQEAGYQPLVREGVRWVNRYQFSDFSCELYPPAVYYSLELRGDTIVSSKSGQHAYMKCYRTVVKPSNPDPVYSPDLVFSKTSPAALLREEGKKVFCVMKTNLLSPYQKNDQNDEFLLYDFSNDQQAVMGWVYFDYAENKEYVQHFYDFTGATIGINGNDSRIYQKGSNLLIEGIGFVSQTMGDLITLPGYTSVNEDNYIGLCQVVDAESNIIYKGPCYSENVSIGQVLGDKSQPADPRWYDLLGRPHETHPTQPGIYIHQGRKVVVK